jgi:hypothetical protein
VTPVLLLESTKLYVMLSYCYCFTGPLPPPGILEIKNITQTSFEVSWKDNSTYRFSHYHIIISNISKAISVEEGICDDNFQNTGNCTFARANVTSIVFDGLDPGVYYNVSIFTSISGVLSKSIQNGTYTRMNICVFLFMLILLLFFKISILL